VSTQEFQSGRHRDAERWRNRLLALLLGLGLAPVVLFGAFFVLTLPTSGTQVCTSCGVQREVVEIGPLLLNTSAQASDGAQVCDPHTWRRTGCWRMAGGGFACYF